MQVGYADGWCAWGSWGGVLGGCWGVLGWLKLISRMLAGPFRVQVGYADGWCWGVLAGLVGGGLGWCYRFSVG